MKLKLTLVDGQRSDDIILTSDLTYRIADLAGAIALARPYGSPPERGQRVTLRVLDGDRPRVLPGEATLADSGLQAGQRIAVTTDGTQYSGSQAAFPQAALLTVIGGPDAGKSFPLRAGGNQVGREAGCDVRLSDPLVSKAHARINVGDQLEIVDLGSSNGIQVRGSSVTKAVFGTAEPVVLGDTVVQITQHVTTTATASARPIVEFNRSPRLDPVYAGDKLVAPQPPQPPSPGRFPLIPLLAPVMMGCLMFAITRNAQSVLFVALSPLMLVGSFFETRIAGKRAFEHAVRSFRSGLKDLEIQLNFALDTEGQGRRAEYPSTPEVVAACSVRGPLTWTRRPDQRAFVDVRLGLGRQPSRNEVALPGTNNTTPELWRELTDIPKRYAEVADVPVVASLSQTGALGIAAPGEAGAAAARSAVLQIAGLHSPAEVIVCGLIAPTNTASWEWLKWLPHTSSDHSPLGVPQLAVANTSALTSALVALVDAREATNRSSGSVPMPRVVVVVDDAASFDRADMVDALERGAAVGVHGIWWSPNVERLPAICRVYVALDPDGSWTVGDTRNGRSDRLSSVDVLEAASAEQVARLMAPMVDAGAPTEDDSDIPRSASFVKVLEDHEIDSSPDTIISRWRASHSLPAEYGRSGERRSKKEILLTAVVGTTGVEPMLLDLRSQGPHALVGGTTGAGKSEFLQTWVLGMAAAHSPDRVNFLFVDYKGGAAFGECVHLPHSVGMVTDLSPHLVRRALKSFRAELRYREELLHDHKANDLVALEKKDLSVAPPSLVIVVDEFAALVKEVPDFVEGVVDVAQRGRSLGLHLILATQRPAGVIKDNLRANTNLRVALRMADEADSTDVVGTKQAALFDHIPGRAVVKIGAGRLTTFQTAYVGGWTSNEPPAPVIEIVALGLGGGDSWDLPEEEDGPSPADRGPNDLRRIVANIVEANRLAGIPAPRLPWQAELATVYDLARLRPSRNDRELVFGVLDDPARQQQVNVQFEPERDGNMAVFGTSGSGKSALLRTLAVIAGSSSEGPCHVYGLDFGSRRLSMLEPLPHVGSIISGDDMERVARLLRWLRSTIDERSTRYAAANASLLSDYRQRAGQPAEPRILVLLDGFAAFRAATEGGGQQALYDSLLSIAADGRAVGVHLVITADRSSVVSSALGASIQRRLVMRLADNSEYSSFGISPEAFTANSPPGRGFLDGQELQVAVLSGSVLDSVQAERIAEWAQELRASNRWPAAPGIRRLPEVVDVGALPASVGGLPALGLASETLEPIGFALDEPFLLTGPPQAERHKYLTAILQSIARSAPTCRLVLLSARPSPLRSAFPWAVVAEGHETVQERAVALVGENGFDGIDGIVLSFLPDLASGSANAALEALVRAAQAAGKWVLAEADSNTVGSAYGVGQLMRLSRHGLALQPDQAEGDSIFRTTFPKGNRNSFTSGRGYYVRHGSTTKVQTASPSGAPG